MTLDGFITFLGLIVAAVAIMSPVAKLQMSLSIRMLTVWSTLLTLAVLYFEFFDFFGLRCPNVMGEICPTISRDGTFTPTQAAFLVTFIWIGVLAYAWQRRPTIKALPTLDSMARMLVEAKRYSDFIELVEPVLTDIDACATGTLPFQIRRSALVGLDEKGGMPLPTTACRRAPVIIAQLWTALKRDYVALLPSDALMRSSADNILQTLMRSRPVVDWIAEHRPRFGSRMFSFQSRKSLDFSERFLHWQISRPGSRLYDEIEGNQNLGSCGYALESHNFLLCALLSNAKIAERHEAYRPIGEHMLAMLDPANAADYIATLNMRHDVHWEDRGRWRDQTFVAIRFFDIMVSAAACQNVRWHMWLFYFSQLIERLEELYVPQEREEELGEFPTRAARLLYDAVHALADWVRLATRVDENSNHREPDNDLVDHENDNIPKSAAIVLGIAMRTVILSSRIGVSLKQTLLTTALQPLTDGHMRLGHDKLRRALINSIVKGGPFGGGPGYLQHVQAIYAPIHKPWHNHLDDFRAALSNESA